MILRARVRPHSTSLVQLFVPLTYALLCLGSSSSVARAACGVAAVVSLVRPCGPLIGGTLFKAPALVVDADGVRLPFAGLHVAWDRVTEVRAHDWRSFGTRHPTVELVVSDPLGLIRTAHWWERGRLRQNLKARGTPVVIRFAALDQPIERFLAAIHDATGLVVAPDPPPALPPTSSRPDRHRQSGKDSRSPFSPMKWRQN